MSLNRKEADGSTTQVAGIPFITKENIGLGKVENKSPEELVAMSMEAGGYVTPGMFGAVGDGVADDTDAFKTAIETGLTVVVPKGNYKITSTLTVKSGQTIKGDGYRESKLLYYGTGALIKGGNYTHVEKIWLQGTSTQGEKNGTNSTATGIDLIGCPYSVVDDCQIWGFDRGVDFGVNTWCARIEHSLIQYCNTGINGAGEFNGIKIDGNTVIFCKTGINVGSGRSVSITNGVLEHNDVGIYIANRHLADIRDCYFENNYEQCIFVSWGNAGPTSVNIECCSFWTSTDYCTEMIAYYMHQDVPFTIKNCWFTHNPSVEIDALCLKNKHSSKLARPIFVDNRVDDGYTVSDQYEYIAKYETTADSKNGYNGHVDDAPIGFVPATGASGAPTVDYSDEGFGYLFTFPLYDGMRKLQIFSSWRAPHIFARTYNYNTTPKWSAWKEFKYTDME